MRKCAVILLFCIALYACKKNETPDVDETLTTIETSAATTSETPPSIATDAAATSATSDSVVTATIDAGPIEVPAPDSTSTQEPFVLDPPPAEKPQRRPRYDYIVDTYYKWTDDEAREAASRAPGVYAFTFKNAAKIMAKRKRDGYQADPPVKIKGVRTSPPELFNYPRVVVVYRKQVG